MTLASPTMTTTWKATATETQLEQLGQRDGLVGVEGLVVLDPHHRHGDVVVHRVVGGVDRQGLVVALARAAAAGRTGRPRSVPAGRCCPRRSRRRSRCRARGSVGVDDGVLVAGLRDGAAAVDGLGAAGHQDEGRDRLVLGRQRPVGRQHRARQAALQRLRGRHLEADALQRRRRGLLQGAALERQDGAVALGVGPPGPDQPGDHGAQGHHRDGAAERLARGAGPGRRDRRSCRGGRG